MLIIPAIDLKDGKCVRLRQGRMDDDTVFDDNPVDVAMRWLRDGARRIHLVDLDGAFAGEPRNASIVSEICKHCGEFLCRSVEVSDLLQPRRLTWMPECNT